MIYGIPCVVAINKFDDDTNREIDIIRRKALAKGAFNCVTSQAHRYGSRGALELAKAVMQACGARDRFNLLYPDNLSIREKINCIARKIYGARRVIFEAKAEEAIARYQRWDWENWPCAWQRRTCRFLMTRT